MGTTDSIKHNKNQLSIVIFRYVTITLAFGVVLFGLSVILGWYAPIEQLNMALCCIIMGVGILALMYNVRYLPTAAGLLVLSINIAVLAEYIFTINLHIDRMPPNTIVCFMLAAATLLFLLRNIDPMLSVDISIIILTFAIVILGGYFSNLRNTYLWQSSIPMPTTAAVGFILLAMTLLSSSVYKALIKKIDLLKNSPAIITLSIFFTTLILTEKVLANDLANHYISNSSVLIFFTGSLFALLFGLLSLLTQHAIYSTNTIKKVLSNMQATLEATEDGIAVFDLDGNLIIHNNRFLEMWDLQLDKNLTYNLQSMTKLVLPKIVNKMEYFIKRKQLALHHEADQTDEIKLKNGKVLKRHVKPQMIDGVIVGRIASYRDMTPQKDLENQLMHKATYDDLTALPNRVFLLEYITHAITAVRHTSAKIGIFLIDIDKFSEINDLFGRNQGDELLNFIATALKQNLPDNCILGRIGVDEFIVICTNIMKNETETAVIIVNKLLESFAKPFIIHAKDIKVTCCIGTAFYPTNGEDADTLLCNADAAMLYAKKEGRNHFQFYKQDMNNYTIKHIELASQLHKAVAEKQFLVYYQPIFNIKENALVGIEALVRWKNDQGKIILPLDFIPLAEEIGLINPIGDFVIMTAFTQAKRWHDAGFSDLNIAFNISAYQFKNGTLVNTIKNAIKKTGINAHNLEIELTESIFIDSSNTVSSTLRELTDMGIQISIDDFGTGYSSFSYVKRFSINKIKIDQIFIRDAVERMEDQIIVNAMIAMGKGLNFKVLAEGVETKKQLELMQQLGCDEAQGFYFARPLPADECTAFLHSHSRGRK